MPRTLALCFALAAGICAPFASADVAMEGAVSYAIDGDTATMAVERISNSSSTRTTGTLYLSLWLTRTAEPETEGYLVARASLASAGSTGQLPPNTYFADVRVQTPYSAPPPGIYYVHLYVSEYPDVALYWDIVTFAEPLDTRYVEFDGPVAYRTDGEHVTLEAEHITNYSARTTNVLHLTLWLTEGADPYGEGWLAARESLAVLGGDGRLGPHSYWPDVRIETAYTEPPPGTYHAHLFVSEAPELDAVLDLVTFAEHLVVEEDDHGDSLADATPVAAPSVTQGRIGAAEDIDVFRLRLERRGTLRVYTTGATDTLAIIVDGDLNVVGEDDDGGSDLNFRIETELDAGTWYVALGSHGSGRGDYALHVEFDPAPPPAAPAFSRHLGDFNGDGKDDVLMRGEDGRWYYYAMDGARYIRGDQGTANLTRNPDYRVAGIGDFDGDGRDDVLMRNVKGPWYYYPMNGRRYIAGRQGPANLTRNLDYRVVGIGDFDGDGRDDVLLRRADGHWLYYAMNGRRYLELGRPDLTRNLDYRVAGVGDFDGDGKADVLMRHARGHWYHYAMDGPRFVRGRQGPANLTPNLDYQLAGIGDFNGDGRDDVLMRRWDGRWYHYAMNGRRYIRGTQGAADLTPNLAYEVVGIGDLDGDGNDDVLLRNDNGRWYYYAMDGRRHIRGRQGPANLSPRLVWSVAYPTYYGGPRPGAIGGTLEVFQGQVLDSDTNDLSDPYLPNDFAVDAQRVPAPASVAGFSDAHADPYDYFLVDFPLPVRISLAIADADADLDLLLADTDDTVLETSLGVDDLEVIQTTRTGEHLVIVEAYSGASNYSLVVSIAESASVAQSDGKTTWSRDPEFVPRELIVKLRPGADGTALADWATEAGVRIEGEPRSAARVMRFDAVAAPPLAPGQARMASTRRYATAALRERAETVALLKALRRDSTLATDMEYAQLNYVYRSMAVPNDPYYIHQWHYPHIGLPAAWNVTTGSDDVVTAVIDSGVVTDHPDLASRMLRDGGGHVIGYDFVSNAASAGDGDGIDSDPYDVGDGDPATGGNSFHGTHVAGTVAAATNNGIGVAGVTWRGEIMPVRVLGAGGGSGYDVVQGIRYAAGLANDSGTLPAVRADVMNLSLGIPNEECLPLGADRYTRDALADAIASGVVVVVSAGNDACHEPDPMSTVDGVISVSATDYTGLAPYSNYGRTVDVAAPGGHLGIDRDGDGYNDGILSTLADDRDGSIAATYNFQQGTSMAAPHVAGVVGLMLAVNPDLSPSDINLLLAGTHPDPSAAPITQDWGLRGRDDAFGHGLIDAYRAVRVAGAIQGGSTEPTGPVLSISPVRLHFGATADVLRVRLANTGTGSLTVTSVEADASWLAVAYDEWPTLVVRADRTGLDDGSYAGHIDIASDGGDLSVPVTMHVQRDVAAANIGTVYVLAVDLDTEELEVRGQAVASAAAGYSFRTDDLSPGRYAVLAGTDRDGDQTICDAGEACGIWPSWDSPAVLEVDGDRTADFAVTIDLFARVSSAGVSSVTPMGADVDATVMLGAAGSSAAAPVPVGLENLRRDLPLGIRVPMVEEKWRSRDRR